MSPKNLSKLALCVLVALAATLVAPSSLLAGPPVKYERIVVVSPVPGDAVASGEELLDALADVGPASATDRWLVQIEPGIYDVGAEPVAMAPFVDIAGSGLKMTVIRGLGQSDAVPFQFDLGVVNGADDSEMRDLTVECRTDATHGACLTIANYQAAPRYLRVRVVATTPGDFHWGFRNTQASPTLEQVQVEVGGGGVDYALANGFGAAPVVIGSELRVTTPRGTAYGLFQSDGGTTARFEDNRVVVEGGLGAVGIFHASPGGFFPPLTIRDATILARGAGTNYGLQGGDHVTTIEHSKITAEGGAGQALSTNEPLGGYRVKASELYAEDVLVLGWEVRIGASQLAGGGGIVGISTEACAGVYDGDFTHYAASCP
jgi:hypothetical protein